MQNLKISQILKRTVLLCLIIFMPVQFAMSKKIDQIEIVKEEFRYERFAADLFYNKYKKRSKVIVLLGGSEGGLSWSSEYDAQNRHDLISRGYALLSLGYFKYENLLPETLEEIPLEYFNRAICWVLKHKRTKGKKVALLGSSKGAEAALLIASKNKNVKAVTALVPSGFVFQGIGEKTVSSWAYRNEPLPFAKFIINDTFFKAIESNEWVDVYREAIADPIVREQTAIEVENAKAHIYLLSGINDTIWPSVEMSDYVMQRLEENDYKYHYEHQSFEGGHWAAFNPLAWQSVLDFFDTYY